MSKKVWLQTTVAMFLVIRVVLFEKYEQTIKYLWWILTFTVALIFYWLDYRVTVAVVLIGFLSSSFIQKMMQSLKPLLLKSGDRVEYVKPDAELQEQFQQAGLISVIPKKEVLKRKLFDSEQIDEYDRFYLLAGKKKTFVIPYEWIIGIEISELPL